jgi:hypothetical protein
MRVVLNLALLGWLFCSGAFAQEPSAAKDLPIVTFTCDFPGSNPDHYFISIAGDGSASYDSTGKLMKQSDDNDPFRIDFKVTEATRARIFELTEKADYFAGRLDSGKKLASMGVKTLTYQDARRNTKATYNYSSRGGVQELTQLLQGMALTLEFGRRLEYECRYEKLALDDELKAMEDENSRGRLVELGAVSPTLEKITKDPTLVNVARARAQRLLAAARSASPESQHGR